MYNFTKKQVGVNITYTITKNNQTIWETKTQIINRFEQSYEEIIDSTTLNIATLINTYSDKFNLNVNFYEDSVVMRKFIFGFIYEELIICKTFVKYCKHSHSEIQDIKNSFLKTTFETLSV